MGQPGRPAVSEGWDRGEVLSFLSLYVGGVMRKALHLSLPLLPRVEQGERAAPSPLVPPPPPPCLLACSASLESREADAPATKSRLHRGALLVASARVEAAAGRATDSAPAAPASSFDTGGDGELPASAVTVGAAAAATEGLEAGEGETAEGVAGPGASPGDAEPGGRFGGTTGGGGGGGAADPAVCRPPVATAVAAVTAPPALAAGAVVDPEGPGVSSGASAGGSELSASERLLAMGHGLNGGMKRRRTRFVLMNPVLFGSKKI